MNGIKPTLGAKGLEPRAESQEPSESSTLRSMPYALRSPTCPATILIVDDEAQICDLLSRVLAKEGYQVRTARSGTEAMYIARNEPIELTLLDLRLPDIDGIQTLRQLKKIDESIVVIMMTAYGALDTAREAMMWGAYDFITKPVDLEFLNQVIKEGLAEEKAQLARG